MKPLSELLAPMKSRLEAATPGPWEYFTEIDTYYDQKTGEPYKSYYRWIKGGEFKTRLASVHGTYGNVDDEGNFIAHSRTDIELLIRALKMADEIITATCVQDSADWHTVRSMAQQAQREIHNILEKK